MNPLLSKGLGSILRALLAMSVGAWLVNSGIWTEAEASEYLTAFVAVAVPVLWGLWDKYKAQQTQNTTIAVLNRLTGPTIDNVTAADIDDVIKSGDTAPATTPKDQAPTLRGTGDGLRLIQSITGTGDGR